MSDTREVRVWHLSPVGWVGGVTGEETPAPDDRVMTCRFIRETLAPGHSKTRSEVMQVDDRALLKRLLKQYGPCPEPS